MRMCVDCGTPARPRTGTRGPHPKRCRNCEIANARKRLESVASRVGGPRRVTECRVCEAAIPETRNRRAVTCGAECQRTYATRYRAGYYRANAATSRKSAAMRKYKLTPGEYNSLVAVTGDRCTICRQPEEGKELAIDHDHATGAVRGRLCQRCNVMIGMARENPVILLRAVDYLESWAVRWARENPE